MTAGIYARVSTADQTAENQILELRRYCDARGWAAAEYIDAGVSGSKDRRPSLDRLMADARRRKVDTVVVWALDRWGRSLAHVVTSIAELDAAGVGFISLRESIDTSSPTGRLLLGVMGSFAQFERERIKERINAGLARARRQGTKLGRRRLRIAPRDLQRVAGLSVREAAKALGVPPSRVHAERLRVFRNPPEPTPEISPEKDGSATPV